MMHPFYSSLMKLGVYHGCVGGILFAVGVSVRFNNDIGDEEEVKSDEVLFIGGSSNLIQIRKRTC